ncbi:uncharacterized protein TNCT_627861 [Trichonephila clavata]|uniref:Integrase catalytic domain-containing protein n=1 Tax=Trichonephila clavata TaxID=2740835 RepID=A0A8X6I233_TRICU|nr:uncharacterized protein TNCT_627861 [Trichonephila clavata]
MATYRGTQFESELYQFLTNFLGSVRIRTPSYPPASNGMLRRFHRPLKISIKWHGTERWITTLPVFLLGIRFCPKEDLGAFRAELLYEKDFASS